MPPLAQWQRNEDNAGMNIIARIIFVLILWTTVYNMVQPDPIPAWYEPTDD